MRGRIKLLFVITQFYKGGAETALVNLFNRLDSERFAVDFLILNQLKLANVVSLTDRLPAWINLYSPAEDRPNIFSVGLEILIRLWQRIGGRRAAPGSIRKLTNKNYDWAFSYGEWLDPGIVAKHISARNKAVWIHTDIDKSLFFDEKLFFNSDAAYRYYLFVSDTSQKGAVKHWPFLEERARVVHNMIDAADIAQKAEESLPGDAANDWKAPVFVCVGNLRPEKNYLRQIEALSIVAAEGHDFSCYIIGNTADALLTQKIRDSIARHGLERNIHLTGGDQNPYRYMKRADAVLNLSDYESWSLVISEALLLGVPVIATRTSGAKEQVVHEENGLLTGFTKETIAAAICRFLTEPELAGHLRRGAGKSASADRVLAEFLSLVERDE